MHSLSIYSLLFIGFSLTKVFRSKVPQEKVWLDTSHSELDIRSTRNKAFGTWHLAIGTRNSTFSIRQSAIGTWHLALDTRNSAFGIRHSALGTQHSALDNQYSAFGTRLSQVEHRCSELGTQHSAITTGHSATSILSSRYSVRDSYQSRLSYQTQLR